jgi:hypothetical protein
MKKVIALCGLLLAAVTLTKAQSPASVVAHSRDFFVVQLSYDMWGGAPDSIRTGGISRGFNVAFMYDFPFKEGSHLSVAPGLGISTSNIFFSDQAPRIGGTSSTLAFPSDSVYKHFKLATAYLEIPVELRYRAYADNANKGFKAGLGLKFGTLLSAHTKGKKILSGSKQVDKLSNKRYFQPWRVAATARVGWGNFSVFTAYSLTSLLEKSAGPTINPVQIGICLSGL